MNLEEIKGIGPKTLKLLNKLDITNIHDLITYYPYRYNFYVPTKLNNVINEPGLVNAKIDTLPQIFYFKKRLNRLTFKISIENKIVNVTIFNRAYLKNNLTIGKIISLYGKYDQLKNNFIASDIRLVPIINPYIEPIYHKVSGLSNKDINKIILNAITNKISIDDYIPTYLNQKYHFIDKYQAVNIVHNPLNLNELKQAKLKLIYEEFFVFMFKMAYLKSKRLKEDNGIIRDISYKKIEKIINELPFSLTSDQLKAIEDIYNDMSKGKRMNRLLLGDVGAGKTIISFLAIYINYLSGYQSVLMAPTEVLARQHYNNFSNLFKDIPCSLLVGSTTSKDKKNIIKDLKDNKINLLIGTHAIIQDNVIFNNLGLVITDEQHRFGVNQRKLIENKGTLTDVMYLSATPIPRTYALALYGDMDMTLIKSKPQNRLDIITKVYQEKDIEIVLNKIYEELKVSHQIYVVAPLIEEEEESNINDIKKLLSNYEKAFGKKYNIGVMHGKMSKKAKEEIMNDFNSGHINILISTTVIEVGVDNPLASVMVIYNAERFGLATLHQLRGRVGRSSIQSYCYLISNKKTPRLNILESTNDGFKIADEDFKLRGEGDLFGVKQSGDMQFKLGDIKKDSKILLQANIDALDYINNHYDNNILYEKIVKEMNITD